MEKQIPQPKKAQPRKVRRNATKCSKTRRNFVSVQLPANAVPVNNPPLTDAEMPF